MKRCFLLLASFVSLVFSAADPEWIAAKDGVLSDLNAAYDSYVAKDAQAAKSKIDGAFERLPEKYREEMERHFDDFHYIIDNDESPDNAKTQIGAITSIIAIVSGEVVKEERKKFANWKAIISEMESVLNSAYSAYEKNDAERAKELINDAYFGYYEKYGVERATLSSISGKRASTVEYQFVLIKNAIKAANDAEVKKLTDQLIVWLNEDAAALDDREISGFSSFFLALMIMLREGVEAILVIAAIIAYLVRSGNARYTREVYIGSILALLASAVMAYIISVILSSEGGAPQEIVEGAAMLTAVVVLFFVSNWMISKSSEEAWKGYIEGKVKSAIGRGSIFALTAAAFLAVFREGAETILFFQALFIEAEGYADMVWLGFGAGCVSLVFVFAAIRYGSLKLPLRSFFIGTSVLMYILCVAFAGGGVKELQEADVVGVTSLPFVPTVDILGIYPTLETLVPQIALLALAVFSFLYYSRKA
ncbi:MAG: FTR1 family iron permease, partial [Helicobacteraceae bacterium]|nr:FTR1 family iron permease [Helicobacteraceae bacterium]